MKWTKIQTAYIWGRIHNSDKAESYPSLVCTAHLQHECPVSLLELTSCTGHQFSHFRGAFRHSQHRVKVDVECACALTWLADIEPATALGHSEVVQLGGLLQRSGAFWVCKVELGAAENGEDGQSLASKLLVN